MLKKLSIRNYALIDALDIDFYSGFSSITGETGAGKSIILGALSLILGQRADFRVIKDESRKAIIEGFFDISDYHLRSFFEEQDLEYEDGACILRREILSSGKSRAFINDTPVSLAQLKDLGERLIDIHSQYQNLLLGNDKFQLHVIDVWGHNNDLLLQYKSVFQNYKLAKKKLLKLQEERVEWKKEEDYLRFQLSQLVDAQLKEGEQEILEQEQKILSHAEEIKGELYTISQLASGDEGGILPILKTLISRAQGLLRIYPDLGELTGRLQSLYIELKDISAEISGKEDSICIDSERLVQVQDRLDMIYRLQQKHQVQTIEELLEVQSQLESKLERIDTSDEEIYALEKEIADRYILLLEISVKLTESRKLAAAEFSRLLEEKARLLGMPNLRFEVELVPRPEIDEMGAEQICFLFSANKNQSMQPVAEVASGGEISRLMLCLKALIAHVTVLPTIIFDEVDTGVSGEVADKMGDIMQEMSQYMQVISITHLPQVASKGRHHYRVYKQDTEISTQTHIEELKDRKRIEEIARMLSGAKLTDEAMNNARVLLGKNI